MSGTLRALRSWKPQEHTLTLTCSIATEPRRVRRSPRFKVYLVRSPKCPLQNPTRSIRSGQYRIWRLTVPFHITIVVSSSSPRWDRSRSHHLVPGVNTQANADINFCSAPCAGLRDGELQPAFRNSGPRRWRSRASDLPLTCGPSRWMERSTCRRSRIGPSHTALIRSDRSRRSTIRRSNCRASRVSLGRIMHSCWLVRKERARKIAG
jgi:hypothetical protein